MSAYLFWVFHWSFSLHSRYCQSRASMKIWIKVARDISILLKRSQANYSPRWLWNYSKVPKRSGGMIFVGRYDIRDFRWKRSSRSRDIFQHKICFTTTMKLSMWLNIQYNYCPPTPSSFNDFWIRNQHTIITSMTLFLDTSIDSLLGGVWRWNFYLRIFKIHLVGK